MLDRAIEHWAHSSHFTDFLAATVTRPLGLAGHGDFTFSNVVFADGPDPVAGPRFIDVRGVWARDLPWWDPILDLATLTTFHCLIEPALGDRDGLSVQGPHRRHTLAPAAVIDVCSNSAAATSWFADDPGRHQRLRLGVLIRLVGSIGSQLTTAPARRAQRARGVLAVLHNLTEDFSPWLS